MKYYVVDAFADKVFAGNPAGVCVVDCDISEQVMQKIAFENNLSETAFVKKTGKGRYYLRWFTPKAEIDLCGHATLGTACVVSQFVDTEVENMSFDTQSGLLTVARRGELFEMELPSRPAKQIEVSDEMTLATGRMPREAYLSRDLMLVYEKQGDIEQIKPDFAKLCAMETGLGVIVTAPGDDCDFVSRCFYPKLMVNEDPVTGSAHSNLIPYWAKRLGKEEMNAVQISERRGSLHCRMCGDRVKISGKAAVYLKGEIFVK